MKFSIPWGLRVPIWKISFGSRVLLLSVLPWCRESPQTAICCLAWLGGLKCLATGLDAFLSTFSTSRRCSRNLSTSRQLPRTPVESLYGGQFTLSTQLIKPNYLWINTSCISAWNQVNTSCNLRRIIASLSGRVETTKRHKTTKRHDETTSRTFCPRSTFIRYCIIFRPRQ